VTCYDDYDYQRRDRSNNVNPKNELVLKRHGYLLRLERLYDFTVSPISKKNKAVNGQAKQTERNSAPTWYFRRHLTTNPQRSMRIISDNRLNTPSIDKKIITEGMGISSRFEYHL
jgi:hypothetical protein